MLGIRNKKLGVSSFLSFYSFLSSVFNHFTEIQKNYPFFFLRYNFKCSKVSSMITQHHNFRACEIETIDEAG